MASKRQQMLLKVTCLVLSSAVLDARIAHTMNNPPVFFPILHCYLWRCQAQSNPVLYVLHPQGLWSYSYHICDFLERFLIWSAFQGSSHFYALNVHSTPVYVFSCDVKIPVDAKF